MLIFDVLGIIKLRVIMLKVIMLTKLERLTSDKHSNLLGQFLSYEWNEMLWIQTQVYSTQNLSRVPVAKFSTFF